MSDANTIRVLEFDGGGERGYLSNTFFNRFVEEWGVDPTTLSDQFNVICGTSVGGIMALAYAIGKTPADLMPFFTTQGPLLFTLGSNVFPPVVTLPIVPSIRPNSVEKAALIIANIPFYNSSGTYANAYGSGLLRSLVEVLFGDMTMQDVRTNVIIPTFDYTTKTFILCSNIDNPAFSAQDELLSNVALATSAAPVYLPPITLVNPLTTMLNGVFFDGGIYQNNPSLFGLSIGKMKKPNANRACILSLSTGTGEYGFDNDPLMMDPMALERDKKKYTSSTTLKMVLQKLGKPVHNLNKLQNKMLEVQVGDISFDTIKFLFELFSIASTGAQDSADEVLYLDSTYTLEQTYYYRFAPALDLTLDPALDNTSPEILTYYENLANETYNDDAQNIATFLGHLTA
jgi:patatin-like phospholipase/acyl hydrolase